MGIGLGCIGVGIGVPLAYAIVRLICSASTEFTAPCAASYRAVAFVLLGTASLASYLPANQASRVDPMVALRCE